MNVPNLLTLFRFALAPLFLVLFVGAGRGNFLEGGLSGWPAFAACLAVVAAAEVSDLLDGYLARRWKQVSDLGKILDPYADSTFHLTCFFSFATGAQGSWLPVWVVLFLFYREVFVEVLRRMGSEKGIYVAASLSGKMKTFTQASVIVIVLVLALAADLPAGRAAGFDPSLAAGIVPPLSWFAVAVTWLSGADYAWRHRAIFRGSGAPAGGSPS